MSTGAAPADGDIRRLKIERSGGFAGVPASAEVDYAALGTAQRAALDKLMREADRQAAAPRDAGAAPQPRGADRFSYRLHLTHADGRQRVIQVSEDEMPEALSTLAKPTLP